MPDVEPIIPVGEQGPAVEMALVHEALRDLSHRYRKLSPEIAFSTMVSFVLTSCMAQEHPMKALQQLAGAVSQGIIEAQNMPQMGTS